MLQFFMQSKLTPTLKFLKGLIFFDTASWGEIDRLLSLGILPNKISFGNTIKKSKDIAKAFNAGIDLFAADSRMELEKISKYAPGSRIYIRFLVASSLAEWPLNNKFGCTSDYVLPLMRHALGLGLRPVGISFHVGSQTRHPYMWQETLDVAASIWHEAQKQGLELSILNLGGGFPVAYDKPITPIHEYGRQLTDYIHDRFNNVKTLMIEPGRGLVGNAGVIVSEVILISRKGVAESDRWVYLDIGKFHGLSETIDDGIKYSFIVPGKEHEDRSPCIIAGPTCDSADILYDTYRPELPNNLKDGDRVLIISCGAYTTTYSSIWFNGFDPLYELIVDLKE